ncbi:MAG TPA: hypothetical protein VJM12_16655 [Pyrinomonadaceae bacterium]|nr:hypothetical protein [Pyrinomonadaceae bacterium]
MQQSVVMESDAQITELRARIARLAGECGCLMGGILLTVAAATAATYFLVVEAPTLGSAALAISCAFIAFVSGKLMGIGIARIRLRLLRRALNARLGSMR